VGYGYLGFMVGVSYVAGVSKSEGFTRPGTPRLSDAEVQQLLTFSLTPGTSWKPVSDKNGGRMWMRSDGKVVAFLSAQKFLQVQEKDFHQPAQ
jgi:predicted type IV restriction endonuclease